MQALVIDRVSVLIRVYGTLARATAILIGITENIFPPADETAYDIFTNRLGAVFTSLGVRRIPGN